jgi:hypothetical protein
MGSFIAGSRDAALEFSANIGKWQLEVIGLIKFDEAAEMTEFGVMIPRSRRSRRPGTKWEPDRPAIAAAEAGRGRLALIWAVFDDPRRPLPRLRGQWPCGKERRTLQGPFGPIPRIRGMLP